MVSQKNWTRLSVLTTTLSVNNDLFLPGASVGNPAYGKGHEEGGLTNAKVGSDLRGPPGFSQVSTLKTRVCLLYCAILSTYSSDITGGLSPTTFL